MISNIYGKYIDRLALQITGNFLFALLEKLLVIQNTDALEFRADADLLVV